MVLGLFDHAVFEEERVQLQRGDFIVAFSDGVTEAVNPDGDEYMDDRLLASIAQHRGVSMQSLEQFLERLLGDVRTFCAGEMPRDDMTLLMVRYDGVR